MILWNDLIAEYRALPPFVQAALAITAVSMACLSSYYVGGTIGKAAYYFLNT